MAAGAMSFRYFILGLLTRQPMSGYDIKCYLDSLGWLIGNTSFGSIYPTLHTLLKDGLVAVDVVSHPDKPPKKVYSVTERGHQALQKWTEQPAGSSNSLKTFMMCLILADRFTRAGLIEHLQKRRVQVAAYHAALEQTVGELDEEADWVQRLVPGYGLAIASAEVNWLDGALDQLSREPLPEEVTESAHAIDTV